MGSPDDPEEYLEKEVENRREALNGIESKGSEPGRSAVSGEMSTEGTEAMLEEAGISRDRSSGESELESLERVNEMFYAIGDDGQGERFDSFIGAESPTIGVKRRHEEAGLAEYDSGFQFLSRDGHTVRKAVSRLQQDTDLELGDVAGVLTKTGGSENPGEVIEMYQEIKAGEYDTQRDLAETVGMNEVVASDKLNEMDEVGLIDRDDSLELTEDGYEVSKTLRGLEAYTSAQ